MEIQCSGCKAVNQVPDLDLLMGVIFGYVDKTEIADTRTACLVNLQPRQFRGDIGRIMGGRAEIVISFEPKEVQERQAKVEEMMGEA